MTELSTVERNSKSERPKGELSWIMRGMFVLGIMFFALLLLRWKRQSYS